MPNNGVGRDEAFAPCRRSIEEEEMRMRRPLQSVALAGLVAAVLATEAPAQSPKRGGILDFAVVAEPPKL